MPVTPKMNEKLLLSYLRDPAPFTPHQLRQLCTSVLVACHDRQVTFEFFAEVADLCLLIETDISMMERAGALRHCLVTFDPERLPATLDEQIDRVCQGLISKRAQLAEKFDLVTMCPIAGDTIS